jgi:S-adenosylmethionine hydrolase
MNSKTIALITDFGIDDPYVGIMKGIMSELSPNTPLIDITNTIPPGDIQRGAFVLWQAAQDFPRGTIFLCVVDPGVGTERKPIFLQTGDQIYIGPDNGLFSYLLYKSDFTCWELSNPEYQRKNSSATFHGRDVFAPAAAYAARSISGTQFGPQVTSLNKLPKPTLSNNERSLTGEILSQDHFGNLFTSLGRFEYKNDSLHYRSWIDNVKIQINDHTKIRIRVNDQRLPLVRTFASIGSGICAGLIGSTGLLEIVANQSSAKSLLGIEKGTSMSLVWE